MYPYRYPEPFEDTRHGPSRNDCPTEVSTPMELTMNFFNKCYRHIYPAVFLLAAFLLAVPPNAYPSWGNPDKLAAEELVTKHLASVGTAEAREAVRTMTAAGTSKAVFKGRGTGEASGLVVMASSGKNYLIGMKFNNPNYPHEKMGYNGDAFSVGMVRPGERTVLGDFMRINESSFEIGVLGGVLSTSWELYDFNEESGKLKCSTPKKMEPGELIECKYEPKGRSELKIQMFFDAATFRHVKTEYRRVISARQGFSVDSSARQSETRYKLEENFSDFREENGLTLPHTYVLNLEILSGNGSTMYEWTMDLSQFLFNNEIDPKEFKVDDY